MHPLYIQSIIVSTHLWMMNLAVSLCTQVGRSAQFCTPAEVLFEPWHSSMCLSVSLSSLHCDFTELPLMSFLLCSDPPSLIPQAASASSLLPGIAFVISRLFMLAVNRGWGAGRHRAWYWLQLQQIEVNGTSGVTWPLFHTGHNLFVSYLHLITRTSLSMHALTEFQAERYL